MKKCAWEDSKLLQIQTGIQHGTAMVPNCSMTDMATLDTVHLLRNDPSSRIRIKIDFTAN